MSLRAVEAGEPALIDGVRDEVADVRVHPIGDAEEHAESGRNGVFSVEQVLQTGLAGISGMAALGRLAKLHLVAYQNQVLGRESHGDLVGQADLSRLVDEQVVELA